MRSFRFVDKMAGIKTLLHLGLVGVMLCLPPGVLAQVAGKHPNRAIPRPQKTPPGMQVALPLDYADRNFVFPRPDGLFDTTWVHFSLEWTRCQIHRVDATAPIEVMLHGTVNSNAANVWRLISIGSESAGLPNLCFVQNVGGTSGSPSQYYIPLSWEISLDGGPFNAFTLLPDNTLVTTIPTGQHSFKVRIIGQPSDPLPDGYYYLQLEQCLLPEL